MNNLMSDFRFFYVQKYKSLQWYNQTTLVHLIKVINVVWGLSIISHLSSSDNTNWKLSLTSEMNLKQISKEWWN